MRLDGATVFHAALIEDLAPCFGVAIFMRLRFIQIARHRGNSQAE